MERKKIGVFVGRMCPLHIGHQTTIEQMIADVGESNSMIILGSVGQKVTFRVLFSYGQRRDWINKVYGDKHLRVVGVPDFPGDNKSWMDLVFDQINSAFYHEPSSDIVFYGGSLEDVEIFHNKGCEIKIIDRSKLPVSATVIRDMMLHGEDVSDFVDESIHTDVVRKFKKVME